MDCIRGIRDRLRNLRRNQPANEQHNRHHSNSASDGGMNESKTGSRKFLGSPQSYQSGTTNQAFDLDDIERNSGSDVTKEDASIASAAGGEDERRIFEYSRKETHRSDNSTEGMIMKNDEQNEAEAVHATYYDNEAAEIVPYNVAEERMGEQGCIEATAEEDDNDDDDSQDVYIYPYPKLSPSQNVNRHKREDSEIEVILSATICEENNNKGGRNNSSEASNESDVYGANENSNFEDVEGKEIYVSRNIPIISAADIEQKSGDVTKIDERDDDKQVEHKKELIEDENGHIIKMEDEITQKMEESDSSESKEDGLVESEASSSGSSDEINNEALSDEIKKVEDAAREENVSCHEKEAQRKYFDQVEKDGTLSDNQSESEIEVDDEQEGRDDESSQSDHSSDEDDGESESEYDESDQSQSSGDQSDISREQLNVSRDCEGEQSRPSKGESNQSNSAAQSLETAVDDSAKDEGSNENSLPSTSYIKNNIQITIIGQVGGQAVEENDKANVDSPANKYQLI
eukprot:gene18715-20604_t